LTGEERRERAKFAEKPQNFPAYLIKSKEGRVK